MYMIHPQAQPFTMEGEKAGCLLIHGFTASPSEMRPLAEYLNKKGLGVRALLLPGHGTVPEHLQHTRYKEWLEAVSHEAQVLKRGGRAVMLVGLSMGGLLALAAVLETENLAGAVAINAPILYRDQTAKWARVLKLVRPYYPKSIGDDVLKLEERGRFAYRVIPVKAFLEVEKLRRHVMINAHEIKVPVLIIQSEKDEVVKPLGAEILFDRLKGARKELFWLSDSPHVATMGKELELLGYKIYDFIERNLWGR